MGTRVAAETARPPLWRDVRVLRVLGQAVFVVLVVFALREAGQTLTGNLDRQNQDIGFGFLDARAGFGINEGIAYSPNETFLKAFFVGLVNTLRIAGAGIVVATILGIVMGVARLSSNWLVRTLARVYVEAIRNTPVLVQIVFWWLAIFLKFGPPAEGGVGLGPFAILSSRTINFAWPRFGDGALLFWIVTAVGLAVAAVVWRSRTRRWQETGEPHHRLPIALGIVLVFAVVGQFVAGSPVSLETPDITGRDIEGGVQLTPAFAAILVGLIVYTSAFIAEIVRGSILAVDKGQKEAAQAIGLSRTQQLRDVVLPQAMRIAIPPMNSQYLNLTKNTSLAIAVGFPDMMSVSRTIMNQTAKATEMLLLVMATYLILSLFISSVMNLANRRLALRGAR